MIARTIERLAPAPPRPTGRRAFTLLEVMLSTAIVAVLLGGVVGAMFVAQRGLAGSTAAADSLSVESRATQMITQDVGLATSITERTGLAVTVVVPDRNSDGQSETIRYAWSGVQGDPLTRQCNGGPPATIAPNVCQFNLTYLLKTLSP